MRHRKAGNKIGRTSSHRRATLRNMATALFTHERIVTTQGKARALRPFAEKLITLGKKGHVAARRQAAQDIHDHTILKKIFDDLAQRFETRAGGYTRMLKIGRRPGDQAEQALVELVDRPEATESASTEE